METLAGRYASIDIKKLREARKSCLFYRWDTTGECGSLHLGTSWSLPMSSYASFNDIGNLQQARKYRLSPRDYFGELS